MRYGLLTLIAAILFVGAADSQDIKKKDKDAKQPPPEISEWAGKTFAQWKKELHNSDPAEREVAFRCIVMFPFDKVYTALPDILQELKKHNNPDPVDLSVRVNGLIAIGKIFLAKQQPDAKLIEYLQTEKKPDPKVVESLQAKQKPDPKHLADAINIFRTSLKDSQIILKVRAVQALPYLGPEARKLLPEVVAVAKDPSSWEVRKEGLICLGILAYPDKGTLDTKLLPEFTRRLDDSSALVRITAINTLSKLANAMEKKEKPFVVAKLVKLAESDKDHRVQIAAHVGIMTVDQKITKTHMGALMSHLADLDPRIRLDAIQALSLSGAEGKKTMPTMVPALIGMIRDPQMEVALAALTALVHLRADEAIPLLKKIADSKLEEQWLREAAEDAIGQMKALDDMEKKMKDQKDKEGKDKKIDKK